MGCAAETCAVTVSVDCDCVWWSVDQPLVITVVAVADVHVLTLLFLSSCSQLMYHEEVSFLNGHRWYYHLTVCCWWNFSFFSLKFYVFGWMSGPSCELWCCCSHFCDLWEPVANICTGRKWLLKHVMCMFLVFVCGSVVKATDLCPVSLGLSPTGTHMSHCWWQEGLPCVSRSATCLGTQCLSPWTREPMTLFVT